MHKTILAAVLLASLAACNGPPAEKKKMQAVGRAETQGIRNTDAIGAGGSAIANKVDSVLNANDHATDNIDKAMEANENPK